MDGEISLKAVIMNEMAKTILAMHWRASKTTRVSAGMDGPKQASLTCSGPLYFGMLTRQAFILRFLQQYQHAIQSPH
jgi:hypothetical protein